VLRSANWLGIRKHQHFRVTITNGGKEEFSSEKFAAWQKENVKSARIEQID